MDKIAWTTVIALIVFVAMAVFFVVVTRRKGGKQNTKINIKVPGMSLDASTSSSADAGVVVEDARSSAGGLNAEDQSGRGVRATRIETQNDILLVNSVRPENESPKS